MWLRDRKEVFSVVLLFLIDTGNCKAWRPNHIQLLLQELQKNGMSKAAIVLFFSIINCNYINNKEVCSEQAIRSGKRYPKLVSFYRLLQHLSLCSGCLLSSLALLSSLVTWLLWLFWSTIIECIQEYFEIGIAMRCIICWSRWTSISNRHSEIMPFIWSFWDILHLHV